MTSRFVNIAFLHASLLLLPFFFPVLQAQNFENGFAFNLPWDDTASVEFLPHFDPGPIGEEDRVSTDGNGSFVVGGAPYRFFGGNLTTRAAFPEKNDAAMVAGRMRKYGINLVRFHHIDNPWSDGSLFYGVNGTRELNGERLDRLDFLIYQLKQHGIYVNMNLNVSRTFENSDGVLYADSLSDFGKGVTLFDPDMIRLQKEYASALLGHVNLYTGTRLADDPVLAMVEIINENTLFRMWYTDALRPISEGGKLPQYYHDMLDSMWIDWLEDRYGSEAALEEAWNRNVTGGDTLLFDGFEQGMVDHWTLELHETAEGTLATTGQAASGDSAALVHLTAGSAETWHTQFKMTGATVKKDSIYEVRFKARAEDAVSIRVNFMRDNEPWTWYGGEDVHLDAGWKEFTFSFKSPENNTGHLRVSFDFTNHLGTFYFDDFLLGTQRNEGLREDESLEQRKVARLSGNEIFGVTQERLRDQTEFYIDLQTGFLEEMRIFLADSLGVQVPMTGTNWFTGPEDVYVERNMDYVDNHSYWDHPQFPSQPWSPTDWKINNTPMLTAPDGTIDNLFSGLRIQGKPYTVSENNHAFPNQFRAELLPVTTSYLSFNDADGYMVFTYSDSWDWDLNMVNGFFDTHRNSSFMGSFPLYAYVFRNYLIDPGTSVVNLSYSKEDILGMPLYIEEWWRPHYPYDPQLAYTHRLEMSVDQEEGIDPGLLPPPSPGPYELSGGQVGWNKEGSLVINTERFASITGFLNTLAPLETDRMELVSGSDFGSVAWLSLVDSALDVSSRSLLAIASKMNNTGMIWDGTNTVHNNWGIEPSLVCPLQLELKLRTTYSHMRITPLDTEGIPRMAEADTVPVDSSGIAVISLDQGEDRTLWYAVEAMDIQEVVDTSTHAPVYLAAMSLTCYPNPAGREICFETNMPLQDPQILVIRDLNGREVFRGAFRETLRVDTSKLPGGIYCYQLTGRNPVSGRFAVAW